MQSRAKMPITPLRLPSAKGKWEARPLTQMMGRPCAAWPYLAPGPHGTGGIETHHPMLTVSGAKAARAPTRLALPVPPLPLSPASSHISGFFNFPIRQNA